MVKFMKMQTGTDSMKNRIGIIKIVISLMVFCFKGNSQEPDFRFINYLINTKQYNEAIFLLKSTQEVGIGSMKVNDSINFLLGRVYYQMKELENSVGAFQLVSESFDSYGKIQLLTAYELSHSKNYNKSIEMLNSFGTNDTIAMNYKYFQLASNYLLQRKMPEYEYFIGQVDSELSVLSSEYQQIKEIGQQVKEFNNKSAWVAGLMSAVVPGSGKIYAGKLGEGVTSLLGIGLLSVLTYENYKNTGMYNYKTIGFGALTALFYSANIYGSVYSVKVYRQEFNKSVDHAILFNLHIPLRNGFPELFN
jgi:hypothetical protein